FEIFQTPADQVTMLFELNHQVRVIVMDRPLPKLEGLITDLRYNGHSVGHFEGDTLIVEAIGLPHGESMSTVERIRKTGNQLEDVITIHDPEFYTRDWQARFVYAARNDVRLEDYACNDTHRDLSGVRGVQRK